MKKETKKEIIIYILIIILVIILRTFIFTTIIVTGTSMEPTLNNNDLMILNLYKYHFNEPQRFDIVGINKDNNKLIKRVIGLPNEKVKYIDNKLYINNELISEDYDHKITEDFDLTNINYETIPDDMYLVLGDNRTNSVDSRYFGLITKDEIIGQATIKLFPWF